MARPTVPMGRLHGFTLVELMVALMVMALLSLMSWRGLDAMGRAQAQTQARADAVLSLQSGLAQWGADLDAMDTDLSNPVSAASAVAVTASTLPSAMDWNGLSLRITRHSNGTLGPSLRVVAWTLGDNAGRKTWLRWQSPELRTRTALQQAWLQAAAWAQSPTAASRAAQVSVMPLDDWQLFYYRGDAWTNPGSSSDAAAATPDGVRLVLSLPDGGPLAGKLTRDWIRPTSVGAKT